MFDRTAAPLARRIRSLQDRYDSALPPGLFAGYLFFTVVMIIVTAAFRLLQFPVETPAGIRIKGFFWEFNWGINHLFFIPIGLTCCALVIREVRRLAGRLCDAGMLVDEDFRELEREAVERDWKAYRPGPKLFGAIVGLSFFEAYWEWYTGSLGPIFGFIAPAEPEFRGWTCGAAVDDTINKAGNAVLSLAAFSAQGFITSYFVYTLAVVLVSAMWLYRYDAEAKRKIVPNPADKDARRGFQAFEPMMVRLLCTAMAFSFVFFAIRLQVIYDSSSSEARTAVEFVLQDVVTGFFIDVRGLFAGRGGLFEADFSQTVLANSIVSAAMVGLVCITIVLPTIILYFLAKGSVNSLENCLEKRACPPCSSRNVTREECRERLATMSFWPISYAKPFELLAYVVLTAFCFVFYKFTIVLFGFLAIRLVRAAFQVLYGPFSRGEARDR